MDVRPRTRAERARRAGNGEDTGTSKGTSVVTSITSSSAVRAREIELQVKKDAAALEEKVELATREIELLEFDLKALIDSLDELKAKEVPQEDQAEWKKEMNAIELDVRRKSREIEEKRINLKYLGRSVAREKEFLERQAEIDRMILEEEELSQDLEGESVPQGFPVTDESVEDFQSMPENNNISPVPSRPPSIDTQDLMRHVFDMKGEDIPNSMTKPKVDAVVKPSAQEESLNAMQQLTMAFTEAIKTAVGSSNEKNNRTEQLITRQSVKQELPPFDGNPEEWPIFLQQFKTVSELCGLKPVENLQRLQKALKGEARESVRALLLSPDNVDKIVDVLGKRYGDPEVVVQRLLKQAQQLQSMREGDYAAILKFTDVVRNMSATAVAMGCEAFLTNPQLLSELVGKLPIPLQVDWTKEKRRLAVTFANLKDFAVWLEDLSEVYVKLNQSAGAKKFVSNQGNWNRHEHRHGHGHGQNHIMVASELNGRRKNDKQCLYCKEGAHFIANCRKFKSRELEDRWKWVKDKRHCYCCLNYGHSVSKCYLKKECKMDGCTKNHHELLHKTEAVSQDNRRESTVPQAIGIAGLNEAEVNLMIVPVVLSGPSGEIETFAMMDTGSTVTLIEEDMANRLGLRGKDKSFSFRGVHPAVQAVKSKVVDLEARGTGESLAYQLKGVRTMANLSLPSQTVNKKTLKKWRHLRRLNVQTFNEGKPTILIGQDNVQLILSRKIVSGPSQAPVAVWTRLGWTVCGKVNPHLQGNWNFHIREVEQLRGLQQPVKHDLSQVAEESSNIEKRIDLAGEIQEETEPDQWRWIITYENMADELTRLECSTTFGPESRWVNGPSFLREGESKWPELTVAERDEKNSG